MLRLKPRVEVRQRLVHQKRGGIAHDRPRQRHPLALAAGQLPRAAVEQVLDLKGGCDLADLRPAMSKAPLTFRIQSG